MKQNIALLLLLFNAFVLNAQNPIEQALGFNVFIEKDAKLGTSETEGPMAIGGNLTIAGNYQVATNYVGNFKVNGLCVGLVVGGKVIYNSGSALEIKQNGYVKIGGSIGSQVWYKSPSNAFTPIQVTPPFSYNNCPKIQLMLGANTFGVSALQNPVFESGLIDFADAFNTLKYNSLSLSVCNGNARLQNAVGVPIINGPYPSAVKINLLAGINYLNLDAADLNNIQNITYLNKPDANKILVINVNAPGTFNWQVWSQTGVGLADCPYIIYNFYNTTRLNLQGNNAIEGSILAPLAHVNKCLNTKNIEGQIIASSLEHTAGENRYANFDAQAIGCAQPTVASFNVADSVQCDYHNLFEFNNTSTLNQPASYAWNFGDGTTSTQQNPKKTYTQAGTYLVELIATGLFGKDTIRKEMVVESRPEKGFTVNDTIQEFTINEFIFTTTNPDVNNNYEWRFGDGSPYANTIDAARIYEATGPYFVCQIVTTQNGCGDTAVQWVTVVADSIGSGNDGGLESKSLGETIGYKIFNQFKTNKGFGVDYATAPNFTAQPIGHNKTFNHFNLADYIPSTLGIGDVMKETTPYDLVNITSALEVLAVDYTKNQQAKAVVLALKTANKAYSHTKYTCDRLRGGKLIAVNPVNIGGYQFAQFTLQQENGVVEYGVSFVVGAKVNQPNLSLQTNWLLTELTTADTLVTFQVWANQPEYANKLVNDIIARLKNNGALTQNNLNTVPALYITHGYRKGSKLVLHVKNNGAPTTVTFEMEELLNEQATVSTISQQFNIPTSTNYVCEIEVKDGYEYSTQLLVNGKPTDIVYMADGNWGLDYDKNYTTLNHFTTNNELNRIYKNNELAVYRTASVSAYGDDYVMLFKGIKQGNATTNLTAYTHVTFFAKGNGHAEVTLAKESIVNWKNQFKQTIELTPEGKIYTLALPEFSSVTYGNNFVPNDVKMIAFSRGSEQPEPETMELTVGSISFIGATTSGITKVKDNVGKATVYPNPNNGNFEVTFLSTKAENIQYQLTDLMGKVIKTGTFNALKGLNTLMVTEEFNHGLFLLQLQSANQKFTTSKVVIH